jgi:5'-nucleotidase
MSQSPARLRILVTNDDGISSQGITTLAAALETRFDVWVVAPDREQSCQSHALTLSRPLRVHELAPRRLAVDGTPADCVYLAVGHLLVNQLDLVVSGINHGPNLGDDVAYSGTVSAAMEAVFMGVPAIAVSLAGRPPWDFQFAADFVARLADSLLERPLAPRTFLNVNVPVREAADIQGVKVTRLGHRRYLHSVHENVDPRGRPYYWIGGKELDFQDLEGTDGNAIRQGYVSITPLAPDLTDYSVLSEPGWLNAVAHKLE